MILVNQRGVKVQEKKSNRKSGGQKAYKGYGLKQIENPDEIIDLKSEFCENCGRDLTADFLLQEKRQVVDVPKPQTYTTEYRQYGTKCAHCGLHQSATFPNKVNSRIQYGNNINHRLPFCLSIHLT